MAAYRDLALRTSAEGFELKERLTIYPEFVHARRFLDSRLAERVRAMADERGYARTRSERTI